LEEETPQLEEETPQLEEETPQLEEETPQLEEETPQLEEETPQLEEETSESEQNILQSTNTNTTAQITIKTTLQPHDVRPHRRGGVYGNELKEELERVMSIINNSTLYGDLHVELFNMLKCICN
jgi:hypothetical protein